MGIRLALHVLKYKEKKNNDGQLMGGRVKDDYGCCYKAKDFVNCFCQVIRELKCRLPHTENSDVKEHSYDNESIITSCLIILSRDFKNDYQKGYSNTSSRTLNLHENSVQNKTTHQETTSFSSEKPYSKNVHNDGEVLISSSLSTIPTLVNVDDSMTKLEKNQEYSSVNDEFDELSTTNIMSIQSGEENISI